MAAVAVVTAVLAVAAVEFFNAVRVAGLQPAVLLGLASVVSMPLAVYWRGESAAGLYWCCRRLRGAVVPVVAPSDSPVRGLGSTMLGILHIGLLGSYAALMLSIPDHGTGLLTAAIIVTVSYDTGALLVGRTMGSLAAVISESQQDTGGIGRRCCGGDWSGVCDGFPVAAFAFG